MAETRVALARGTIAELVALPFWVPMLGRYGLEIFTTERPPTPDGLLVFAGLLQALLWLRAWGLRIACLAEMHEFSLARGVLTVLASWLAGLLLLAGFVLAVAGMVGK